MVNRGNRYHRYCYFCREFWQNRIAATNPPMNPCDTKIPHDPDQGDFISKWLEFHAGTRPLERPWHLVDPGTLPLASHQDARPTVFHTVRSRTSESGEHTSIDETMDRLIRAAEDEDEDEHVNILTERNVLECAEAFRDAEAEKERCLQAVREARFRQMALTRELSEASEHFQRAMARRVVACDDVNLRRRELEAATLQRYGPRPAEATSGVFPTAQEIERQDPNYVSPLTTMFGRATDRYNAAEEVRAAVRTHAEHTERYIALVREIHADAPWHRNNGRMEPQPNDVDIRPVAAHYRDIPQRTLDDPEDNRPAPLSDHEMTVKLSCKVCLQQRAEVAVIPCGHLVMCSWCAPICCPGTREDGTTTRRTHCPFCRSLVRRVVKVYIP